MADDGAKTVLKSASGFFSGLSGVLLWVVAFFFFTLGECGHACAANTGPESSIGLGDVIAPFADLFAKFSWAMAGICAVAGVVLVLVAFGFFGSLFRGLWKSGQSAPPMAPPPPPSSAVIDLPPDAFHEAPPTDPTDNA